MYMTERKSAEEMTEFGKTLNRTMVAHDVYTWTALRERLKGIGYEIGQSQLSQYIYGIRNPQELQALFAALSEALNLTTDEEMRLTYAFAYPHGGGRISRETIERSVAAEEEVRARKRVRERQAEGDNNRTGNHRV